MVNWHVTILTNVVIVMILVAAAALAVGGGAKKPETDATAKTQLWLKQNI